MATYSSIIASLPRLFNGRDAEDYVAGPTMLEDLRKNWGLKPIDSRPRLTTYDRNDIDAAIERKKIATCGARC